LFHTGKRCGTTNGFSYYTAWWPHPGHLRGRGCIISYTCIWIFCRENSCATPKKGVAQQMVFLANLHGGLTAALSEGESALFPIRIFGYSAGKIVVPHRKKVWHNKYYY